MIRYTEIALRVDISAGSYIEGVVKECIDLSKQLKIAVAGTFNGYELFVLPDDLVEDIVKDYRDYLKEEKHGS